MKPIRIFVAVLLAVWGAPVAAHAGGILVGESGSQAQERGGAFVAKADDPMALSMNPAGLVKAKHIDIYLGMNLLNFGLDFQRQVTQPIMGEPTSFPKATNTANWQPVPELVVVEKLTANLAIAEGIYVPQGFPNRDFKCLANDNCTVDAAGTPAPQRYDIVHQESILAFPSLAIAYRILPGLDVGVRGSWGFATVKARNFPWAGTNHAEDPGFDGDFEADTSDNMILSFGAGVLYRPTDNLELGRSFTSGGRVRGRGHGTTVLGSKVTFPGLGQDFIEPVPDDQAVCGHGGTAAQLTTCIDFDLPRKAQLGGRYIFRDGKGREKADIELDGRWEGHNADSNPLVTVDGRDHILLRNLRPTLIRHGFENVWSGRLGGSYRFAVGTDQGVTVRAGFAYDTAAAADSWTRLDIDGRPRASYSMGLAYDLPGFQFDAGVTLVAEPDVTVTRVDNPDPTFDNRSQPDPPQPIFDLNQQVYHPINEGSYSSGYVVATFGINASF